MSIMPTAPDGLSGGNKTRIINDMLRAKSSAMGGNQSAMNVMAQQSGPVKRRPKSQVNGYEDAGNPSLPANVQPSSPVGQSPLSAMSAVHMTPPEDPVERYNRNAAIEKLISSPEMMDTVTRLKLRNHFQGRPDEGLGTEALQILQASGGRA